MVYEGTVRLGDLFESRRERGRPGLPLLSVTMNDGLVDRDDLDRKQETSLAPDEHLLVKPGDIAYNMMRMWQGAFGLASREGLVSPAYVVLKPRAQIDPAFAAHFLRTPRLLYLLWAYSHGITDDRLRLYYDDFASIKVSVPDLGSQRDIARKLGAWDGSMFVATRLAENARLLRRALLQRLLPLHAGSTDVPEGWTWIRLGDVVSTNPKRPAKPADGRVSFVPMEAVSVDGHLSGCLVRDYDEVREGHPGFADGDLLVAKITPCFENGKGALVSGLTNGIGFGSTEFFVLRPSGGVDSRLLGHVLRSERFRRRGSTEMEGSAGQKRISIDFIRSFRFLCPTSLTKQRELADLIHQADCLISEGEALRAILKSEKQAVAQRLFAAREQFEHTQ